MSNREFFLSNCCLDVTSYRCTCSCHFQPASFHYFIIPLQSLQHFSNAGVDFVLKILHNRTAGTRVLVQGFVSIVMDAKLTGSIGFCYSILLPCSRLVILILLIYLQSYSQQRRECELIAHILLHIFGYSHTPVHQ